MSVPYDRRSLQALFRRFHLTLSLALALALLAACGGTAPPATDQALATISAGLDAPTPAPAPTLTAKERETFATVRERVVSMRLAGQKLVLLGDAVRATTEWKQSVRTFAQVITGGQQTIAAVQFSDSYAPLAKRTRAAIEGCGRAAEALLALDIDQLAPSSIAAQKEAIERWCVTELERVRLTIDSL